MKAISITRLMILLTSVAGGSVVSHAQTFPSKPVRIITSEVGGPADLLSRVIAERLTPSLGQQVIVDNRPGGSGIAGPIVAKSPPDGHTLFVAANALWILPLLREVPYDAVRDFAPITLALSSPNVLVVHPSLPANTVKELIALAKRKPGAINYASSAIGTSSHLAAELFKTMAGVDMVRIPYNGGGPAAIAMIAGESQVMFSTAVAASPYVKAGKLRALAVTSAEPSVLAPGVPTVAAAGLPGYECVLTLGLFAPQKTPEPVINRLNQEVVRILMLADVKALLLSSGSETRGSTPKQLAQTMEVETATMSKVIKSAGIREK